jgi:hypothetical protein
MKLSLSRRDLMGRESRVAVGVPLGHDMLNTNGSTAQQQPTPANEERGVMTILASKENQQPRGSVLTQSEFATTTRALPAATRKLK